MVYCASINNASSVISQGLENNKLSQDQLNKLSTQRLDLVRQNLFEIGKSFTREQLAQQHSKRLIERPKKKLTLKRKLEYQTEENKAKKKTKTIAKKPIESNAFKFLSLKSTKTNAAVNQSHKTTKNQSEKSELMLKALTVGYLMSKSSPNKSHLPLHKQAKSAVDQIKLTQNEYLSILQSRQMLSSTKSAQLGENKSFEDVLMEFLFRFAKQKNKEVMDKIKTFERGSLGTNKMIQKGIKTAAGIAGAAIGAKFYSTAGAVAGRTIAENISGAYTGEYSEESRQLQLEKIKHELHKVSELTSLITNISNLMHNTNQTIVNNSRA